MEIKNAAFVTSLAAYAENPPINLAQVAVVGKSNVGKSSLINALCNRRKLCKISATPGKTRLINVFLINDAFHLVDLPGYGFAKAPEEIRAQWEGLLAPYLRYRSPLVGLVVIMDCRHPLTDLDLQMLEWFAPTGKPIHVLLSKADKLTRQEQADVLREVGAVLARLGEHCTVQLFSSLKRTGVAEAEAVLGAWMDMAVQPDLPPPSAPRTEKQARPRNRKAIGWSARSAGGRKTKV